MQLALPAAVRAVLLEHGVEPAGPLGVGAAGLRWSALGPDGRRYAVVHASGPLAAEVRTRAAALAHLDHPGLARCADVFPVPGGVVVLVEAEPGTDLAVLLEARGRLDPGEVVGVLAPAAEALAVLHRAGLAHGDVAPANIVVSAGRPVLVDLLGGADVQETGTDGFAPAGRERGPSAAADVAALGLVGQALLGAAGEAREAREAREPGQADPPQTDAVRAVCALATGPADERPSAADLAEAFRAACPAVPLGPADPAVLARLGLRRFSGVAPLAAAPVTRRVSRAGRRPARQWFRRRLRGPRRMLGVLGMVALVGTVGGLGAAALGGETASEAAVRLSRQRAAAVMAGDTVALTGVTVPGSPAARADEEAGEAPTAADDAARRGPTSAGVSASDPRDWDLEAVAEAEVACAAPPEPSGLVTLSGPTTSAGSSAARVRQVCVRVRTVTVYDGVAGTPRRVVLVLERGPWRVAEVRSAE